MDIGYRNTAEVYRAVGQFTQSERRSFSVRAFESKPHIARRSRLRHAIDIQRIQVGRIIDQPGNRVIHSRGGYKIEPAAGGGFGQDRGRSIRVVEFPIRKNLEGRDRTARTVFAKTRPQHGRRRGVGRIVEANLETIGHHGRNRIKCPAQICGGRRELIKGCRAGRQIHRLGALP